MRAAGDFRSAQHHRRVVLPVEMGSALARCAFADCISHDLTRSPRLRDPELGRGPEDFDVVFGYPWGGEEPTMRDVMRRFRQRDARLPLSDTNEGGKLYRAGKEFLQTL